MKSEIKYIELKSGYSDNGPAWIGIVDFSKTRKTIYFNGQAFKGNGHGYARDIQNGDLYWISGVKKNGLDRHWAGGGKIFIDKNIVQEYLELTGIIQLDLKKYELVEIAETDKQLFNELENQNVNPSMNPETDNLSITELEKILTELKREEKYSDSKDGKKFLRIKISEIEELIEQKSI